MNTLKTPALTSLVWLMARLWLSYEWLHTGIEKVFGEGNVAWIGDKAGAGVSGFLKGAFAKSPLGEGFDITKTPHPAVSEWYATLARDVFLPNALLVIYLVAFWFVAGDLLVCQTALSMFEKRHTLCLVSNKYLISLCLRLELK